MPAMVWVSDQAQLESYFLRGLLWCEPCGELLVPATTTDNRRFYGCPNRRCPRPLIEAASVEIAAWQRYTALNEEAARRVRRDQRHEALVELLARVTIGSTIVDLGFDWRE